METKAIFFLFNCKAYKSIEITKKRFTLPSHIGIKFFPYR